MTEFNINSVTSNSNIFLNQKMQMLKLSTNNLETANSFVHVHAEMYNMYMLHLTVL